MREQDIYGIDRPSSHGRITPLVALPDTTELTQPIRLPRPHLGAKSVVYDIGDRSVMYTSEEVGGRYPRHISSRRLSSQDLTNLTPPSQAHTPPTPLRRGQSIQAFEAAEAPPTMIPRVVVREHLVAQPPVEGMIGEQPLRNPAPVPLERPTLPAAIQRAETESLESVNESIRSIQTRALFRNTSLSYQRFLFSLAKFPALVLVLCSLWTLWGRGEGIPHRLKNEKSADIAALVTGGFVLACEVLLLHQHYNCYKKAKVMSYLYHFSMLLSFCGSVIALVFAATSFGDLKNVKNDPNTFTCKVATPPEGALPTPQFCLQPQERIDYMGVIVGCSSFIIIVAFAAMTFGAVGQALMKKKLSQEYQRISAARAHTNQAMQY